MLSSRSTVSQVFLSLVHDIVIAILVLAATFAFSAAIYIVVRVSAVFCHAVCKNSQAITEHVS